MRAWLQVGVLAIATLCVPASQAAEDSRLKALEQQLNGLGQRIERLQDLTDIEIVQDAYGCYVDRAQWRSLSALFQRFSRRFTSDHSAVYTWPCTLPGA